jgi:hypothetical protein
VSWGGTMSPELRFRKWKVAGTSNLYFQISTFLLKRENRKENQETRNSKLVNVEELVLLLNGIL